MFRRDFWEEDGAHVASERSYLGKEWDTVVTYRAGKGADVLKDEACCKFSRRTTFGLKRTYLGFAMAFQEGLQGYST